MHLGQSPEVCDDEKDGFGAFGFPVLSILSVAQVYFPFALTTATQNCTHENATACLDPILQEKRNF